MAMAMAMASSHLTSFLRLLLLLSLQQLHLSTTAQSYRNLTLGSSLSPDGANTSYLSPSGDFAFGFHSLESNVTLFLLAIWFEKTAEKTVVWSANRDEPVQSGSKFELTTAGLLSLQDPTGRMVWNSTVTGSHASMLDTGNLVLYGPDGSSILWQSFDFPTDTILPSQSFDPGTNIWARLTDDDYSTGRFRLSVQGDGNLVLYPVSLPAGNVYGAYWASNTNNGSKLIFNESGSIDYLLEGGARFQFTSDEVYNSRGSYYYRRGTLDPDGVFRQYVRPKTRNGGEGWTGVDFKPSDICIAAISSGGSGACGFNSYCNASGTATKRVECECPPQYSFLDPARRYKGCKPDFAWQSCEAVDGAAENFDFTVMNNIDWTNMDYQLSTPVDEEQCRNQCLSDCFCGVAIYNNGNCWKKKFPLSNGRMGANVDRVALIKVPKFSNNQPQISPSGKRNRQQRYWALVGMSVSPFSVCLNLLLIATIVGLGTTMKRNNKRMKNLRPIGDEEIMPGVGLRRFTYEELDAAANGFNEELGRGSFGRVYKGYLSSDECVAIKKLGNLVESSEKEFMAEIRSIGKTHHKNLTRLVGFCREGTERLLVYEFMPNGSLTGFLFGDVRPVWGHRMQIALGIARGLSYLHYECSTQIVHCDIKPQNVLLDEYLVARISDFGLAKLLRGDQTRTNTAVRGTRGYVAPDWFKNSAVTSKVDVYSYGVMLLEIICCRKSVQLEILNNNELEETDDEEAILSFWAYDCYSQGRVDLLVEGDDVAAADIATVERFATVAIWCIQEEPNLRPNMRQVIQMLEGVVPVPVPPNPFK